MKSMKLQTAIVAILIGAGLMTGGDAMSDDATRVGGVESVYGHVEPQQVEFLSSEARIISVAKSGAATAIWEALEHGERVECLECIPSVEPLIYDRNARTREIAAWWLRRRVFGVFGPGEVYEQTLNTLKGDASPQRRAYAAYALGEFLLTPGIDACAAAVSSDADPQVRAAAASALGRLNDDGKGALLTALKDGDANVRLAAIGAAGRVSTHADVKAFTDGLTGLTGDANVVVRRRAVELLDSMRVKDSVSAVIGLAKTDADENVRIAACHALGAFQDKAAQATLESIAQSDASGLVRDQAKIALRRL